MRSVCFVLLSFKFNTLIQFKSNEKNKFSEILNQPATENVLFLKKLGRQLTHVIFARFAVYKPHIEIGSIK